MCLVSVRACGDGVLQAYTDTEVYQEVLDVLGGLLRQSTQEALDWVAEHRQKLKKLGVSFLF